MSDVSVLCAQGATVWVRLEAPVPLRQPRAPSAPRRGVVRTFSDRSRRRLRITLHRMKWPRYVLFATLTFAEPVAHWFAKQELHRILVWLERKLPGWWIVWKLEFQERGVHHFHLLLFPPESVKSPFLSHGELWEHWKNGFVWIELVHVRRLASYIAKYVGKSAGEGETGPGVASLDQTAISEHAAGPGRFWGIRGKVVWAPIVREVPGWAVRKALAVVGKIIEKWQAQGIQVRGIVVVLIDKQILPKGP